MIEVEDVPDPLAGTLARNDALNRAHRAGYLAGIEAARACVPDTSIDRSFNACRNLTLTNLTALEQEAGSADKADGRYTPEIRAAINKLSPKG